MDVSRETEARLATYAALVRRWSPRINLVSAATLPDLETRHIADSAQIMQLVKTENISSWVDLGSGGGFPGLVLAILLSESNPKAKVTLIESDKRKATFLRTVVRETGLDATVIGNRLENVPPLQADHLSARALAPLTTLLGLANRHMCTESTSFFPKGRGWKKEVEDARENWGFTCIPHGSITNPDAVILEIRDVTHA